MFKVGEPVWHQQFKRGVVAYSMPGDVRVLFDDESQNPLISTEAPAYVSKKGIEDLPTADRIQLMEQIEEAKAAGAPLDGHVIYFAGGGGADNRTLTKYEYPLQDGFFQVMKVQQPFAGMKYEEQPGRYKAKGPAGPTPEGKRKFYPAEGIIDLKLQDQNGRKYTVQINRDQTPSMYVAKKVPADSLAVLFNEGELFWGEQQAETGEDEL